MFGNFRSRNEFNLFDGVNLEERQERNGGKKRAEVYNGVLTCLQVCNDCLGIEFCFKNWIFFKDGWFLFRWFKQGDAYGYWVLLIIKDREIERNKR